MALKIDEITEFFNARGTVQYGAQAVSQQQHALQCAYLAEPAGGSPELVAAALLHDLGHLLPKVVSQAAEADVAVDTGTCIGVDDLHQFLTIPFLRGIFPEVVLAPIRLHVDAKRYLCQLDKSYWASLSPASQRSLVLQGGPFSIEQAQAFITQPFATDAVALRRWDDGAKNPAVVTPEWEHYVDVLRQAACCVDSPL